MKETFTSKPGKYVFGPVPSRRLGRSLGIDLVPYKICTFDCIYCQLGGTTMKTIERKEYVPVEDILSEIDSKMSRGPMPDYITLSGSGEPTLHSNIGNIVSAIKKRCTIPLAVLTNGSLLWDEEVRASLLGADLVLPSLDAGDEQIFQYVNRPHKELAFKRITGGMETFRKEYRGQIWLEVFLLGGVSAFESEVKKFARIIKRISPDRVQLNTVSRPPAEDFAFGIPPEQMHRLASSFGERAEIIAEFQCQFTDKAKQTGDDDILRLLSRRPCTLRDISEGLCVHSGEILKRIENLMVRDDVSATRLNGEIFYSCNKRKV